MRLPTLFPAGSVSAESVTPLFRPRLRFPHPDYLEQWLQQHGIDTAAWCSGPHKCVDSLWHELLARDCVLASSPLRRHVHAVHLVIRRGATVLIERAQTLPDGRRRTRNLLPAEKIRLDEDVLAAAARCLREELRVSPLRARFLHDTYRQTTSERESTSYPGLITRYVSHIIGVQVDGLPDGPFSTTEEPALAVAGVHGTRAHEWVWQRPMGVSAEFAAAAGQAPKASHIPNERGDH